MLTKMWEDLVLACIGEMFEDPDVVGVVLQTRIKEDTLFIWNKDCNQRNRIWERIRQILHLSPHCPGVEYRSHRGNLDQCLQSKAELEQTNPDQPLSVEPQKEEPKVQVQVDDLPQQETKN